MARENRLLPPGLDWVESYQRDGDEWVLPKNNDEDDPTICAILQTPSGRITVYIDVMIDGKPFRSIRESLIDRLENREYVGQKIPTTLFKSDATDARVAIDFEDPNPHTDEVTPALANRPDLLTRLRSYFVGREVNRDEARWLISEWAPGPPVLLLRDGFGSERSRLSPLMAAIDTDNDRQLSADEIKMARAVILSLDENENGVLESEEISASPVKMTRDLWSPFKLITRCDIVHSADSLATKRHASKQQAESFRTMNIRLELGDPADGRGRLTLVSIDPRLHHSRDSGNNASKERAFATEDAIVVELPRVRLEIVAYQQSNFVHINHGQVSIGAVVDGYPLLRNLDSNGDSRLERSEWAHLVDNLMQLDRNQDGIVRATEIDVPIRLAIGVGPVVHQVLARPSSAIVRHEQATSTKLPDWFTGMDENDDSELTRTEFLGSDQQFVAQDLNSDGLIDAWEAAGARHK